MEVADTELGAWNVHREKGTRSARQILNVAITSVLWAARDGACALFTDFLLQCLVSGACMDVLWLRRLGDDALKVGSGDELRFTAIPLSQDLGRRSTAKDARMNQARESDMRQMAR